jgi:alkaline phosphatase
MGAYIDGFVIPIAKKRLPAYRKMALIGAKVWKKHGALEYFECVGDVLDPAFTGGKFPIMTKTKKGETVIFSFIVFKSRKHRDSVNAKVMKDPIMNETPITAMPFDMKRMSYGGFKTIIAR